MATQVSGRGEKFLRETQAPYLANEEREVLARFLARLESECGDAIRRVILFGSKARGEADKESDTDLLVVATDKDAAARVYQVEETFKSESYAPISVLVATVEGYRNLQYLKSPIYVNIRRDGVELWNPAAQLREESEIPLDFIEGEFREMNKATRDSIQDYVRRSHAYWKQTLYMKQGGFLDGAVSRAYYAVFCAASAALYAVNIVRGKHSGIEAAISQFLVKPGFIEPEYADLYTRLMKTRIQIDYGKERDDEPGVRQFETPPEAVLEQMLTDAERFVARMEQFLRERGAID
jgi:uncharacterized protein (UPF0332 family)/predicted nucleotidyltransferase